MSSHCHSTKKYDVRPVTKREIAEGGHTPNNQIPDGHHVFWAADVSSEGEDLVRCRSCPVGEQCPAGGSNPLQIVLGSSDKTAVMRGCISLAKVQLHCGPVTHTLAPSEAYRFARSSPQPELAPMIRTLSSRNLIRLDRFGGAGETSGVRRRTEGTITARERSQGGRLAESGDGTTEGR